MPPPTHGWPAEERAAVEDLLVRYATAVDTRRWELLREVFTPDASIDYASTGGMVGRFGEVLPWLEATMARFKILQHFVSNLRLEDDGPALRARSYVLAKHGYLREGSMVFFAMGGEYEDRILRTEAGPRIERRILRARWFEGELPPP